VVRADQRHAWRCSGHRRFLLLNNSVRRNIRHRDGRCQYDWTLMSSQKRQYTMRRRAELEEQTRRRITESAVELHEELGPAQTSISAIADRAGVRRSTVYRHFPDEDALFAACSAHWRAANPPPDPSSWSATVATHKRPRTATRS